MVDINKKNFGRFVLNKPNYLGISVQILRNIIFNNMEENKSKDIIPEHIKKYDEILRNVKNSENPPKTIGEFGDAMYHHINTDTNIINTKNNIESILTNSLYKFQYNDISANQILSNNISVKQETFLTLNEFYNSLAKFIMNTKKPLVKINNSTYEKQLIVLEIEELKELINYYKNNK